MWRQTDYQLIHNGMDTSKIYKTVEKGLINRSIPLSVLGQLMRAGSDKVKLQLDYLGKDVGMKGVGLIRYLSAAEERYVKAADKPINSVKQLRAYASALPVLLQKARLIDNHYLRVGADTEGRSVRRIRTIPGITHLIPLTEIELKLVHKMPLEKATRWLIQNIRRTGAPITAVFDGVITDKKTYDRVRGMNPSHSVKEIEKLTKAHIKASFDHDKHVE